VSLPQGNCLSLTGTGFLALDPPRRQTAARHALDALLAPLEAGWLLSCLDDDSLLISADTLEARLTETECLGREEDALPLTGGRGYVPADRAGRPVRPEDVCRGGAVWVLRLLTGAFPWESGAARRRMAAEHLTEEDLAEDYLLGLLPFAFDPAADGPWEDRAGADWKALPAAARDWFLAHFRDPRQGLWTPAELRRLGRALEADPAET
jgi:hypothetical protein